MTTTPINHPTVGAYVWSEAGYLDHGPLEGPKTTIPPRTLGQIIGTEKPYFTMDQLLYSVRWTTGQTTKHYSNKLFCTGPFETPEAFRAALGKAEQAKLTQGPRGGFLEFTAIIPHNGAFHILHYDKGSGATFREFVEPVISQAGIIVSVKSK